MKLEASGSHLTKAAVMKKVKWCFSRNLDCFTLEDWKTHSEYLVTIV